MRIGVRPRVKKFAARAAVWIGWGVTLGLVAIEVFSYCLPQDLLRRSEPYATLVCISFFGRVLTFHFGLMLGLVAIGAAVLRNRRLRLVSGLLACVCLAPAVPTLLPSWHRDRAGPTLRVMSMNLKYTHEHPELIVAQIRKNDPDVLAIEDYTPFAQQVIGDAVGQRYPNREFLFNYFQGLAIYSKLPFTEPVRISFTPTRRQMRAVVRFHDQPIVVYVEHPFSPRSKQRILNNRMATLDLAGQVQSEKLPVIALGDFNFTDATPNESVLKSVGLADAFEAVGWGRGSTWPVSPQWLSWLPGVRIDHVFFSSQLHCSRFFVGDYDGSDHLPIVADLWLGK
jgi:endonuclease/exonuclease/phosphatase (EEP) superfamily protein YafD